MHLHEGGAGRMTCEELAERHLGVDLRQPPFWRAVVVRRLAPVPEFVRLADQEVDSSGAALVAEPNFQMLSAVLANSHCLSSRLRNAMRRRNRFRPAR